MRRSTALGSLLVAQERSGGGARAIATALRGAPIAAADEVLAQALAATTQRVVIIDVPSLRIRALSAPLLLEFADQEFQGRHVRHYIVGDPSEAAPLLATGKIEGYELTRQVRLATGVEDARLWVHALGNHRPPHSAVVVIDLEDAGQATPSPRNVGGASVIGSVDDEWRLDRVSSDAKHFLGADAEALRGVNILTLVHPGDLAEFLTGLGHAQAAGAGVTLRLRIRRADGDWRWVRMQVSPLGTRPAFAFSIGSFDVRRTGDNTALELEQTLARIAREVHTARVAQSVGELPTLVDVPLLSRLTAREWEIAAMVRTGAGINEVARSLHLSPSTVRNHLSAIYGKLGVRSLPQLLVLLHAAPDQRRPVA